MCFSPEMDATAGLIVTAIGVDAIRNVRRRDQLALATLPVLFGLHQLIETAVWLDLQGHVGDTVGAVAAWVYLLIALVIVPVAVPYAFLRLGGGRWPRLAPVMLGAGLIAGAAGLWPLRLGDIPRHIDGHQITYQVGHPFVVTVVTLSLYVVATCGPPLVSRSRALQLFGVLNLVVVGTLAALNQSGVISLWCVWAAATSVLINLYIRGTLPARAARAAEPAEV